MPVTPPLLVPGGIGRESYKNWKFLFYIRTDNGKPMRYILNLNFNPYFHFSFNFKLVQISFYFRGMSSQNFSRTNRLNYSQLVTFFLKNINFIKTIWNSSPKYSCSPVYSDYSGWSNMRTSGRFLVFGVEKASSLNLGEHSMLVPEAVGQTIRSHERFS